jgi:hypothetical protein
MGLSRPVMGLPAFLKARSQNYEKLRLASSCLCVFLSAGLSVGGFSWSSIFMYFSKRRRENLSFIKI